MKLTGYLKTSKLIGVLCILSLLTIQTKSQMVIFEHGAPSPGTEVGYSVMEAADNTLIVVGSTTSDTEGLADIKVSKLTAEGTEIWSVTHGGFNNDFPHSSVMLEDGSFVIVGTTGSFTDSPSRDVYLLKMDSDGEILWSHSYGGSSNDEGTDIKQTPEGDFIITAYTESYGEGEMDGWLLKTDSDGILLWDQTFGGNEMDILWSVDISPDGGYIIAGGTHSFADGIGEDFWLIKTDTSGNEIWNETFGVANRTDLGRDVVATADGYVAVGIYDNDPQSPPPASGEAYLIKVDFEGNLIWEQIYMSAFRFECFDICPAQEGGWLIGGTKVITPSYAVFWVAKTDSTGEILWEAGLGQPASISIALNVIQTYNGDVVATGFSGLTTSSPQDLHLVRLSDQTVSISEVEEPVNFAVMPNPTRGNLKIVFGENHSEGSLLMRNIAGIVVASRKFNYSDAVDLDLSGLPAGTYILQVSTNAGVGHTKILKY